MSVSKRPYRFDPGRAPGPVLAEIAASLNGRVIAALEAEDVDPRLRAWEARKKLKRLRALLRIVRFADPRTYRTENRRIRDGGRVLAPYRDADVAARTLQAVRERFSGFLAPGALDGPADALGAPAAPGAHGRDDEVPAGLPAALDVVRANAHITAAALRQADWDAIGAEPLARAAARDYRRARKALGRLDETGGTEAAHELRKAIKTHWLHVRLLRPAWPADDKRHERAVREAVDAFGAMQDFDVLARALAGLETLSAPERELALALVSARRADARDAGHMAARHALSPKPKAVGKAIAAGLSALEDAPSTRAA